MDKPAGMPDSASTRGVHHVGLTVPDITKTRHFFLEALGFEQVGEVPEYPAVYLSDGTVMLTLWQAADPGKAIPFDRRNCIGLHHLALRIARDQTLEGLHHRLEGFPDVAIEFAPEPLGQSGLHHMMCTVPGGVRLELIAA